MLSRGAAANAKSAKRNVFHNHIDFNMYHLNTVHEQVNNDINDSEADNISNELDAYFDSIDIERCDDFTLQAYAAYQCCRQSKPSHPFDAKTMIPKEAFQSTTREFQQAWGSQNPKVKAKVIKDIQDATASFQSIPTLAQSTAIVPYNASVSRSANLMELSQGPLTTDVIKKFLTDASIGSVCDLQAFSSSAINRS